MFSKTITCLSFAAFLVLAGCGSSTTAGDGTIGGNPFVFVTKGTLTTATGGGVTGTGSLALLNPVSLPNNSYRIMFAIADGGTLDFIANAATGLTGAVTLRFTRAGTTLSVVGVTSGGTKDLSAAFAAGVDASTTLTFQVDVHNDENPPHVKLWDAAVTTFTGATARLDTANAGFVLATGQGTGKIWGFALTNATVTGAVPSAAHDD